MRKKARRVLRTAHLALEDDDADSAVNRAYYAAFYLASAALSLVGEHPKTHNGTVSRFWVRFVKTGEFPRTVAQHLSRAFGARQKADYSFIGVHDTAAAADLLRDVEAFVDAAEDLVERLSAQRRND